MTKEEAIKIVRENMHLSNDEGNIFEALKTLVPELRESEDEKIRRALIKQFSAISMETWAGISKIDIIAYLEKQKEQKPIKVYDNMDDLIADAMIDDISKSDMSDSSKHNRIYWINKHRQKPAEWSEEDKSILNNIVAYKYLNIDDLEWLKSLPDRFNLQPKVEWSEEEVPDETKQECGSIDVSRSIKTSRIETLKNLLSYFKGERKSTREEINTSFIPCLEYLLKDAENSNDCAEWSEEDEAAFGDLMWCIEQARKSAKDENDMGDIWFAENWVKNRLKFLRPRHITYALDAPLGYDKDMNPIYPPINHWKPTEKQIAALEWQIKNTYDGSWQRKESESLYDDLKKL